MSETGRMTMDPQLSRTLAALLAVEAHVRSKGQDADTDLAHALREIIGGFSNLAVRVDELERRLGSK